MADSTQPAMTAPAGSNPAVDLLFELGTEELPPLSLAELGESLQRNLLDELDKADVQHGAARYYATPRRLAVWIKDVARCQPEQRLERRGPTIKAAFDAQGRPSNAALGFARSCQVAVDSLQVVETDKGAWLAHVTTKPGRATAELLPEWVSRAVDRLPVARRMRWADRDVSFVRPVHWVLLLLGDTPVPASVLGVQAGRESRGHRFHCPRPLPIPAPAAYAAVLEAQGRVIADIGVRRERIVQQAQAIAASVGGQARIDPQVLTEVTALVEWPVALLGRFDERFLAIPPEVLITTMQGNQKYFPVTDGAGRLMPLFVAIANLESRDPQQVCAGNERVIRPRFADAEFFWNQDRRQPLLAQQPALKATVFQQRLGSLYDRCARLARLGRSMAEAAGANPAWVERAAWLSKCDLLTQMVREFPELQGTMGYYYAVHDGEPEEVARALAEQYQPRYAGDGLPKTRTGQVLAMADRLDLLVGIFAVNEIPSGAKDPFGLRRAALGLLRLLIEGRHDLDLQILLEATAEGFDPAVKAAAVVEAGVDFCMERLRHWYLEQGYRPDEFEAVLACRPTRPLDFAQRLDAVAAFRRLPEAASLASANKRIRNLLKKVEGTLPAQIDARLLREEPERRLAEQLSALLAEVVPLLEQRRYDQALTRLATLREAVDAFFDQVMVMTEDSALRHNRLALLNELS
ncbi:MAG: glycine--tRNA ligase subunit beta, partial [Pseudomonadota bacterium]|nr:glycine--tRNA ligase subunit beta [Pseudomonadota bacterium]